MDVYLGSCLAVGDFLVRGEKYFFLQTDACGDIQMWTPHPVRLVADRHFAVDAIITGETVYPFLETGMHVRVTYRAGETKESRGHATLHVSDQDDGDVSWCITPFFGRP